MQLHVYLMMRLISHNSDINSDEVFLTRFPQALQHSTYNFFATCISRRDRKKMQVSSTIVVRPEIDTESGSHTKVDASHVTSGADQVSLSATSDNLIQLTSQVARLATTLLQSQTYRPTFTLAAFVSASQCQRGRWKTYEPTRTWSKEKCMDMYSELRAFVQRRYVSPQQLTGFEAFRHSQVLFGHFAVTQILLHDQQRFHPTLTRPYPPMPRILRQAFQLMVKSNAKTRDGSGAPIRYRGRSAFRRTTLYRDGKPIFVQARSKRIRIGTQSISSIHKNWTPMASDGMFHTSNCKLPCVSRCSIADIRCNKYIIHHGLGVDLATRLPNGQTVAAFATQYIYNEHVRRLTRKRLRPSSNKPKHTQLLAVSNTHQSPQLSLQIGSKRARNRVITRE